MKNLEAVKIFALGMIVAILGIMAINNSRSEARAADNASAGSIIALTSQSGTNGKYASLFLVDTATQHIAVYWADDSNFNFISARKYGNDIAIDELKPKRGGYSLRDAEKEYEKQTKKDAK